MATISASIQLYDRVSAPIQGMISAVDSLCSAFNDVDSAMNNGFDVDRIYEARNAIDRAAQGFNEVTDEIQNSTNNQEKFNNSVQHANSYASNLLSTFGRLVGTYATFQTLGKIINLSDELTQTTARLNQMNDGLQTTEELTNMIHQAAQNARGSYVDMASVVARFGNNAKDAFGSSAEVVDFAEIIQKQMVIAGAGVNEANAAMTQLSQALGSGVLRGDELNSIFEQAPNLIQSIADYMDVPIGKIREMASEGQLTADIVKNAVFASADEVNAKFEEMPMTWNQAWSSFKNSALKAFTPVLKKLNDIANSDRFQEFVLDATNSMYTFADVTSRTLDMVSAIGAFLYDDWSVIEPLIVGATTALGLYTAALLLNNTIQGISAVIAGTKAAADMMATGATFAATAAQYGFNAALFACPITWIIALIIALVAVIYAVCDAIAKATGIANSGFSMIAGGISVVLAFFKNFALSVVNGFLGIGNAIAAVASNMLIAFQNSIANVQTCFYGLLSVALSVIAQIAEALSQLPFVEFDASGIRAAAANYANKAAEAAGSKKDYNSAADAYYDGATTYDTYKDGWASDAYDKGSSWADGVADKASDAWNNITNGGGGGSYGGADVANQIANNTGSTADSAGKIADAVDISNENLKYLRDAAEKEAINRFTTAEIKVEMTNNNNVSSDTDIDGMVTHLANGVSEALEIAAEGVHV